MKIRKFINKVRHDESTDSVDTWTRAEEISKDVTQTWDIAKKYGLEFEVMVSTLIYLDANPGATIEDALTVGLLEWVK